MLVYCTYKIEVYQDIWCHIFVAKKKNPLWYTIETWLSSLLTPDLLLQRKTKQIFIQVLNSKLGITLRVSVTSATILTAKRITV